MLKNNLVSRVPKSALYHLKFLSLSLTSFFLIFTFDANAHDISPNGINTVGTLWLMTSAALVFFMNAGFSMLETGLCRTRNSVNVLAKNLIVFCISTIAFWFFGFRFMFGDSSNNVFGQFGLFLDFPLPSKDLLNPFPKGFENLSSAWEGRPFASLFFFQLVFAGTAATIVSGAVAERIKFWAFIIFSFVLVGVIYPLSGYWVWGGGWLSSDVINFKDFAGSTVVHSVGGIAALTGTWLMKPRDGRFGYNIENNSFSEKEDKEAFKSYSISLATLGCLILWLGWFGFNGGSTTNLKYVPHIITTTFCAAAAGGFCSVILSPSVTNQKVNLPSIINGILGGLVGITASSAYVNITGSFIIGALSGILVLLSESFLKFMKIDDPVGAIPVHLCCGCWGTIAVGIFADPSTIGYQIENYNRLSQIFYQILGWTSVTIITGSLCTITWITIGIVLFFLENENKNTNINIILDTHKFKNFSDEYGMMGFLIDLFQLGRQGIRVSPSMERAGEDPTVNA